MDQGLKPFEDLGGGSRESETLDPTQGLLRGGGLEIEWQLPGELLVTS